MVVARKTPSRPNLPSASTWALSLKVSGGASVPLYTTGRSTILFHQQEFQMRALPLDGARLNIAGNPQPLACRRWSPCHPVP